MQMSKRQIKTKEIVENAREGNTAAQDKVERLGGRVWTQDELDALNLLRSSTREQLERKRILLLLPEGFVLPKITFGILEEVNGLWGVYLLKRIWLCRFQFEDGTIKDFLVKVNDEDAEALGDVSEWTHNINL